MSDAHPAHEVAKVLAGGARLDLVPTRGRIEVKLGEGADENGLLFDAGVLEQALAEADAAGLVEVERLGLGEETGGEVLGAAVAQGELRNFGVEFFDLGRGEDGDVAVRMRGGEETVGLIVRKAPGRRNRKAEIAVEGVPEEAGVKCFAGKSHGWDAPVLSQSAPNQPKLTHPGQEKTVPEA